MELWLVEGSRRPREACKNDGTNLYLNILFGVLEWCGGGVSKPDLRADTEKKNSFSIVRYKPSDRSYLSNLFDAYFTCSGVRFDPTDRRTRKQFSCLEKPRLIELRVGTTYELVTNCHSLWMEI